jgi:alkanesulfonate monooxygenase SsuD/methylene tetrahydromethanopterin reductase-like flavin-dependent oxidoreductase (luciferase family)
VKVGIGLPAAVPGTSGQQIVAWARLADEGPFSSVGVTDRLVYSNYEPLIALAGAATVTSRVRLVTTVLLAPLRGAGMLAKQAASVDALSNGRLTLGLGIGARDDDYKAAPVELGNRGARFEHGLELMQRVWAGTSPVEGVDPVGPTPVQAGGPELILGGSTPAALKRIGRMGFGFMSGGGGPERAKTNFKVVMDARAENGHSSNPRFMALSYFGLSDEAGEKTRAGIRHYYSFLGPVADGMASSIPVGPRAVKDVLAGFEDIGVDEVILYSGTTDVRELHQLADLLKG